MSYLDDAVTQVRTPGDRSAFLVVEATPVTGTNTRLDAEDLAVRYYRREERYDGPVHTVSGECDDGHEVAVFEDDESADVRAVTDGGVDCPRGDDSPNHYRVGISADGTLVVEAENEAEARRRVNERDGLPAEVLTSYLDVPYAVTVERMDE